MYVLYKNSYGVRFVVSIGVFVEATKRKTTLTDVVIKEVITENEFLEDLKPCITKAINDDKTEKEILHVLTNDRGLCMDYAKELIEKMKNAPRCISFDGSRIRCAAQN